MALGMGRERANLSSVMGPLVPNRSTTMTSSLFHQNSAVSAAAWGAWSAYAPASNEDENSVSPPPAPQKSHLFGSQSDPSFGHWSANDSWYNVYNWINSSQGSTNDSEGGDERSSSNSSHHQHQPISPKQSAAAAWPPALNDDCNFGLFDVSASRMSSSLSPATPSPPVQQQPPMNPLFDKTAIEYDIIRELLKLNLGSKPVDAIPQPQPVAQQKMMAPLVATPPSTSMSPWQMPDEPIYRSSMTSSAANVVPPAPIQKQQRSSRSSQERQGWGRVSQDSAPPPPPPAAVKSQVDLFAQLNQSQNQDMSYLVPQINAAAAAVVANRDMYWQQQQQQNQNNVVVGANNGEMDLQNRLEECSEEYRQLEKERKQTEAELARHNLGKKISSSNGLPIPRLPTAPSRVDRLIVDFFREHARIATLLGKMEQLRGGPLPQAVHSALKELLDTVTVLQQCRYHERTVILQQLRGEITRYNKEKENAAMTQALIAVRHAACRARSANWCSLVWTLGPEDDTQAAQVDTLSAMDFSIGPPPIRPRPLKH